MKKLICLIVLLFLSVTCFAYTIKYLGTTKNAPAALQGRYTETAVSKNEGETWIEGLSTQIKITEGSISIESDEYTIEKVFKYKDDQGLFGYLVKLNGIPDDFEFWFLDENTIMLIVHDGQIESMRCRLTR